MGNAHTFYSTNKSGGINKEYIEVDVKNNIKVGFK